MSDQREVTTLPGWRGGPRRLVIRNDGVFDQVVRPSGWSVIVPPGQCVIVEVGGSGASTVEIPPAICPREEKP